MRFPLYFFLFKFERSNCHRVGWLVCMLGARSFRVFLLLTTATGNSISMCVMFCCGNGHSESKCICALNLLLFSALLRAVYCSPLCLLTFLNTDATHTRRKWEGKKCMTTTRSFGCLDALCIRLALGTFKFRCVPKAQYTIASIVIF